MNDKTPKIYLSRRNLLALLSKLDRDEKGDSTHCTILKYKDKTPQYQQTMDTIAVIAVHDDEYYGALGRPAGEMHPSDEVNLSEPLTGKRYSGPLM